MCKKSQIQTGGCHRSIDSESKQDDYTISLPILHQTAVQSAKDIGCTIEKNKIIGTIAQAEAFMSLQNPMLQNQYNSSKHLNGAWNPLSRKLELVLPEQKIGHILMSASVLRSDKMVSTGFTPIVYENFEQVAEAMHQYAHSSSIYSPINRWDPYQKRMKLDWRRRKHNISFIGNILVYDFDNGSLSFDEAIEMMKNNDLHGLVIRSKNDPKYDFDRFKMLIHTDLFFPMYRKDEAPEGFQKADFNQYKEIYIGLARKYGFWEYADHSTTDASRLIAQVNNRNSERREYVTV